MEVEDEFEEELSFYEDEPMVHVNERMNLARPGNPLAQTLVQNHTLVPSFGEQKVARKRLLETDHAKFHQIKSNASEVIMDSAFSNTQHSCKNPRAHLHIELDWSSSKIDRKSPSSFDSPSAFSEAVSPSKYNTTISSSAFNTAVSPNKLNSSISPRGLNGFSPSRIQSTLTGNSPTTLIGGISHSPPYVHSTPLSTTNTTICQTDATSPNTNDRFTVQSRTDTLNRESPFCVQSPVHFETHHHKRIKLQHNTNNQIHYAPLPVRIQALKGPNSDAVVDRMLRNESFSPLNEVIKHFQFN